MSTFNKMLIGSVLSAVLLVLFHSGAWAIRSAQSIAAAQALENPSVISMSAGNIVASNSKASSDSCSTTSH